MVKIFQNPLSPFPDLFSDFGQYKMIFFFYDFFLYNWPGFFEIIEKLLDYEISNIMSWISISSAYPTNLQLKNYVLMQQ